MYYTHILKWKKTLFWFHNWPKRKKIWKQFYGITPRLKEHNEGLGHHVPLLASWVLENGTENSRKCFCKVIIRKARSVIDIYVNSSKLFNPHMIEEFMDSYHWHIPPAKKKKITKKLWNWNSTRQSHVSPR